MKTFKLKSKIHLVTITGANKDYEGSITISKELMDAAGIAEYEQVHVNSRDTGQHWITYAISGEDGEICMNGAPANLVKVGESVHILSYAIYDQKVKSFEYDHKTGEVKPVETEHNPIVVNCKNNRLQD